jgi:hypothetical protein
MVALKYDEDDDLEQCEDKGVVFLDVEPVNGLDWIDGDDSAGVRTVMLVGQIVPPGALLYLGANQPLTDQHLRDVAIALDRIARNR